MIPPASKAWGLVGSTSVAPLSWLHPSTSRIDYDEYESAVYLEFVDGFAMLGDFRLKRKGYRPQRRSTVPFGPTARIFESALAQTPHRSISVGVSDWLQELPSK